MPVADSPSSRRCIAGILLALAVVALAATSLWLGWQWREQRQAIQAHTPSRVDIGFAQAMARHHQQAVLIAQLMLDGRPSPLAGLAQGVVGAQLQEIGRLQGWLALWGKPELPNGLGMDWMLLGREPPDDALRAWLLECQRRGTMPGAPAQDDLRRLHTLAGVERDRLFAELMLRHHEGAIPMARFAASNATMAAVRNLAAQIVLEQTEEIATLRRVQSRIPPVAH